MKIRSLVALLLILVMAFTVSCGKSTDSGGGKKPSSSGKNESTVEQTDDNTNSSDDLGGDNTVNSGGGGTGSNNLGNLGNTGNAGDSSTPNTDNSAAADLTDLESLYRSPIQQTGTDVGASTLRTVNVNTSKTVFTDFMSFGANLHPGILTDVGKQESGMNSVYFEIEKKRYISAKPQYNRFLFQISNMITNVELNPARDDWENNADYINYKNGVYDFENDYMRGVYQYLDVIKAGGGKVYINFGHTNASRIWKWYCLRDDNVSQCAPRDTDLFSKACVALLEELILNRGYDNVIGVSFFNEPNSNNHFDAIGSKPAYYASIIKKTCTLLDKSRLKGKLQILGGEVSNIRIDNRGFLDDINRLCGDLIDTYTAHNYSSSVKNVSKGIPEPIIYSFNYKLGSFLKNYYKKQIFFGEFNTGNYDYKEDLTKTKVDDSEGGAWTWNTSNASYFIACANSGVSGAARWSYTGQYWPDPAGYGPTENNYHSLYLCPVSLDATQNGVLDKYYEDSLLTNYVKAGSEVLMVDWTGIDTRVAAFKLPDGNYTVVVEVNESTASREINLNFDKSIGKTFYRMSFSHDVINNGNATVQPCEKKFSNVGNSITDTVGKGYAYYVYTTCTPIKQVELNTVTATLGAGESVQFTASLVDCSASDEIVWSISASEGGHVGTVSASGKYTAAADAVAGDMVAVKAALKSDPMIYSVAIIKIK